MAMATTLGTLPEVNAAGLVALFLSEAAGLFGERIDLRCRLLLAHAAEQVGGFLQTVGGAARFGFTLLRRGCAAHVVGRLAQPVQRLLDARIARFSSRARLSRRT